MCFVTLFTKVWYFVKAHLSTSVKVVKSSFSKVSIFIRTKREAFHNLFKKFQVDLTLSISKRKSVPKATSVVK